MNNREWFMLIYETEDAGSQEYMADRLFLVPGVTTHIDQSDSQYFVVIECQADIAALTLHEMVMAIDHSAVLVGSHTGSLTRQLLESA